MSRTCKGYMSNQTRWGRLWRSTSEAGDKFSFTCWWGGSLCAKELFLEQLLWNVFPFLSVERTKEVSILFWPQ